MESKESNAESNKMKFDVYNVDIPNCASKEIMLMFCDIFTIKHVNINLIMLLLAHEI